MTNRIGFGAARFPPQPEATRAERIERAEQMLARALNLRTLVAVVGNGCSQPLGYPGWAGFARGVLEHSLSALESRQDEEATTSVLAEVRVHHDELLRAEEPEPTDLAYLDRDRKTTGSR